LNLLVLEGASGGGSGGFQGYFLHDHMSILDKELGISFYHGAVIDICIDKELDTILDMDQDKNLDIVLGMGLCRDLYRDLDMGLHKDLGIIPGMDLYVGLVQRMDQQFPRELLSIGLS
jgi:hypothetical protein